VRQRALDSRVPELGSWALDGRSPAVRFLADDGRVLATVEMKDQDMLRTAFVMACLQEANLEVILTVAPSGQGLAVDEVEPSHIVAVDMYYGNGLVPDTYVWAGTIHSDQSITAADPGTLRSANVASTTKRSTADADHVTTDQSTAYLDRVIHSILQMWHWARGQYSPADLINPEIRLTDMLEEWQNEGQSTVTMP
jgi:hypothetical protein